MSYHFSSLIKKLEHIEKNNLIMKGDIVMSIKMRSNIMLTLAAFIWGTAFVAQSVGMEYVGAFTFCAARFLIGGITLIPFIFFTRKKENQREIKNRQSIKTAVIGGICCGIILCISSNLQQIGISYTTVGKAGFITTLYIVLVPVFSIFLKKKVGIHIWISVIVATIGMYFLCMTENMMIAKGDFFVFLCAIGFTFHILVIDYFSPKADGILMSCIQFFTAGVVSFFFMIGFESPSIEALWNARIPILYAGVMSCGIAFTLQILAQKHTQPFIASLLMSLESVFSVLAGFLLLNQTMSKRELVGCAFVFFAVLLAQWNGSYKRLKDSKLYTISE